MLHSHQPQSDQWTEESSAFFRKHSITTGASLSTSTGKAVSEGNVRSCNIYFLQYTPSRSDFYSLRQRTAPRKGEPEAEVGKIAIHYLNILEC